MLPLRISGPGSNGNEGILSITQSFRIGASPFDGLVSYLEHSLEGQEGLILQQRCSRCIPKSQPTGLYL